MKISFNKSDLGNCLTMLNYVGRRNTLPILNGTLIEVGDGEATLIATDLETTVKTAAAVEVLDDTDMHKLCLPVKELRGMLKGVDRYERIVIEANLIARLQ